PRRRERVGIRRLREHRQRVVRPFLIDIEECQQRQRAAFGRGVIGLRQSFQAALVKIELIVCPQQAHVIERQCLHGLDNRNRNRNRGGGRSGRRREGSGGW